jgi:hypothetical protein
MSPQHPQSSKTILVVDDDSSVVTVVCKILTTCGYQVLEATSVEEAIAAVEQNRSGIDLLVVDAVMPKVSGPELADILLPFASRDEGLVYHRPGQPGDPAGVRPALWIRAKAVYPLVLVSKVQEALGETHQSAGG